MNLEQLGNNIRKVRQRGDLTQENVAFDLHISLNTYNNIERGVTNVPFLRLVQLADYFHVNVAEFLSEPKNNTPPKYSNDVLAKDISIIKRELNEVKTLLEKRVKKTRQHS